MKVAFASCSSIAGQHDNQPLWGVIHAQKPDLLLLLGDNVYIGKNGYEPVLPDTKESVLEGKYKRQLDEPHFKKLLDKIPYLVIWDNHDFGLPGHNYEPTGTDPVPIYGDYVSTQHRHMARGLFNKYLKYGSLRPWTEHVYCSYTMNNVKFIMLDVRSRQQNPDRPEAKLIDDVQRDWLWNEMLSSEAEINVICSGLTYTTANEDGLSWSKYEKFFEQFNKKAAQTSKPIFLGGNIHNNVFIPRQVRHTDETPYQPFYEVASSGVGQSFKSPETPMHELPEVIGWGDNDEEDKPLEGRPRNNYGIIDFTSTEVIVSLYGQRKDAMHYAKIRRGDWSLKEYWHMKNAAP